MGAEVTLASQGGRVTLGARTMEEEEGDNRGYFYDSDRCGRNSDSPFSSDEEVDGLNDGADTPSKFAPRSSSKHMTELEWASFGAAEAGLGAEVLNVNEHGACVISSSTSWFGDMRDSLSMANSTYPGGAYTLCHPAQEENIFRRTDAHFSLTNAVLTRNQGGVVVYTEEMQHLINADEGRVYFSKTPLICIKGKEDGSMPNLGYELLKKNDIFSFYELRSAAVNANKVKKNLWSFHKIKETMTQRIHAQFRTLIENKVRHVVLSAFGCGAFGNDAFMVANIYKDAIGVYKDNFSVIAFAIYYAGCGVNNYDVFSKILIPESSRDDDTQEIDKESDYPYSEDETEEKVVAS